MRNDRQAAHRQTQPRNIVAGQQVDVHARHALPAQLQHANRLALGDRGLDRSVITDADLTLSDAMISVT